MVVFISTFAVFTFLRIVGVKFTVLDGAVFSNQSTVYALFEEERKR